jgi:hypothetical protein
MFYSVQQLQLQKSNFKKYYFNDWQNVFKVASLLNTKKPEHTCIRQLWKLIDVLM